MLFYRKVRINFSMTIKKLCIWEKELLGIINDFCLRRLFQEILATPLLPNIFSMHIIFQKRKNFVTFQAWFFFHFCLLFIFNFSTFVPFFFDFEVNQKLMRPWISITIYPAIRKMSNASPGTLFHPKIFSFFTKYKLADFHWAEWKRLMWIDAKCRQL